MKLYSEYSGSSISMTEDSMLCDTLRNLIRSKEVSHVVEAGTCTGEGSTRFLADCFAGIARPRMFLTIEANFKFWWRACKNLKRYPFVEPLWGLTVNRSKAVEFIKNDDVLDNHEKIRDIYIDDIVNPKHFYLNEVSGRLGGLSAKARLASTLLRPLYWKGEDLLRRVLTPIRENRPLIVLDSAGGIGWLEFSTVVEVMGDFEYFLLLDDIHHLKHFRSYATVRQSDKFEIQGVNESAGWMLAAHC